MKKLANSLIISRFIPAEGCRQAVVCAYIEENRLVELQLEDEQEISILNHIYVGKVQNIVKNINAAFIEIEKDIVCYYSLEELKNPIFTKKQGTKPLVIGDELLVQVVKEGIKTKAPVVTTNLSFTGKYIVLTTGKSGIGVSNKLSLGKKEKLKEMLEPFCEENLGIIARTSAGDAKAEAILAELERMKHSVRKLLADALHRTCYSRIYGSEERFLVPARKNYVNQLDEIITDKKDIYDKLKYYFDKNQPEEMKKLRFYEDSLLPLYKLYNLQGQIQDALRTRVWLKSGAYLLIEQTEAFVVIDVNTGKYEGKRKRQETFLKINEEAAKEIARQLRLRNLSGIILIDFINMESPEFEKRLMNTLDGYVRSDSVRTDVIDITRLGIMELTRKKEKRSLKEMIQTLL